MINLSKDDKNVKDTTFEQKGEGRLSLSQQKVNIEKRIEGYKNNVEDLKNPDTPVKANNIIITENYNSNITEQIAQMARQNRVLEAIKRQSLQNQEGTTEKHNQLSDFIEKGRIFFC